MKKLKLTLALLAGLAVASVTTTAFAGDDKEVTISGNMVCGKCTLHETDKCQNVVQVMEDGKTVNYYLKQNAVSKKEHAAVCHGDSEKVTVTGTVAEVDGKKMLTPTKIDVVK
jgi:type 1 fimbria pilin